MDSDKWRRVLIAALTTLIGIPTLAYPLGPDQGVFQYVADVWRQGGLPYRDAWDIKPVGTYALYMIPQFLIGVQEIGPRILDLIAVFLTVLGLNRLCELHVPRAAPNWSGFLYSFIYFSSFSFANLAQSESLSAPFCVWGFLLALDKRRSPMSTGILMGLCAAALWVVKPTMLLLFVPAVILMFGTQKNRFIALGSLITTATVVTIIVYIALTLAGLSPYLRELHAVQREYAASTDPPSLARIYMQLLGYEIYPVMYAAVAISFFAILTGFVGRLTTYCMILAFIIVAVQGKFIAYHFIPLLLPVSIACATLIGLIRLSARRTSNYWSKFLMRTLYRIAPLVLCLTSVPYFVVPFFLQTGRISKEKFLSLQTSGYYSRLDAHQVAQYLSSLQRTPITSVLVYGFEPNVYLELKLHAKQRFFVNQIVGQGWYPDWFEIRAYKEIIGSIRVDPPQYIVYQAGLSGPFGLIRSIKTVRIQGKHYRYINKFGNLLIFEYFEHA